MGTTINLTAGNYTSGIQKRTLGKLNIGFYCDCGEFVAFAIAGRAQKGQVAFACDGPIEFTCPFCRRPQKRVVTEFHELILTEGNKQRPARPGR